jgi:hypothetical protein
VREKEKPQSAAAVIATLTTVTAPVPSLRIARSLKRLERIVPPAMIIEITPAAETETPSSRYIDGHAEPRIASGRPG